MLDLLVHRVFCLHRFLSVVYNVDLNKSAYFDGAKNSSFIKIHIVGTTLEGFPVDYSETISPKDGLLEKKDHLIIDLQVSETKSMMLKATPVE